MAVAWTSPAARSKRPANTPPHSDEATGGVMNTGWTCETSARTAGATPDSRREMGILYTNGAETHKISGELNLAGRPRVTQSEVERRRPDSATAPPSETATCKDAKTFRLGVRQLRTMPSTDT